MMIPLENGGFVNADKVRSIRSGRGERTTILIGDDGAEHIANGNVDDIASAINGIVIKAEPGYQAIFSTTESCDKFFYWKEEIIAWRVGDGLPEPITVASEKDAQYHCFILTLGGKVICQYDGATFATSEEWARSAKGQWEKARAKHLEKAKEAIIVAG